ncbi:hypothetical protein D0469_14595 [Peribacillus saganii]|uniref:DOD-type homing endonuclease domain-containing protein n=1 Tax=Peribacillus saganii TaxID=2303992 RepID=A0A372LLH8_9BACI|nr:hypothetical protein D0469_14595 [Peribacillus saganii]
MFASLFGTGASNKHIPDEIMNLSENKLESVLDQYLSGDGYKRNKQTEYTTASSNIAYQVLLLLLKCGKIPSLRKNKKCNPNHWVGGYTENGKPDNKRLILRDDNYVHHPVRRVTIYLDKKVSYNFAV